MQSHILVVQQEIVNDKSDVDSLMKAKLALTELEKVEPASKQVIDFKCKLYPKLLNALLENKQMTEEQLDYANDVLCELRGIDAGKKIVDKYELLLNRKLLTLAIPSVSAHPAALFSRAEAGEASLRKLEEAKGTLAETEELAKSIIGNLQVQRKTIKNATRNAGEVNKELHTSNRLLTKMNRG